MGIRTEFSIPPAKATDAEADVSALEAEIDALVFDLYGLTPSEHSLVEGGGK